MNTENKFFYVGLKAFILEGDSSFFERETPYTKELAWELPGGRIQHDESETPLKDILLREVSEECGEGLKIQVGEIAHVFRRQFSNGEWVFLVGFECQYISGDITISDEHTEYAWIGLNDLEKYEFVNGYKEAIGSFFAKRSV